MMPRDVGGDERGAEALRLEGAALLVGRADERALLVVEHRAVDGAGQVVLGEFRRAPRVEDRVPAARARRAVSGSRTRAAGRSRATGSCVMSSVPCLSSGSSVGHTLSRMRGCAGRRGMELVGLEELAPVGDAVEQERHQGARAPSAATCAIELAELARVFDAIIRRNHEPDEHRFGPGGARKADHLPRGWRERRPRGWPRRPSLAPELDHHEGRLVALEVLGQAPAGPRRWFRPTRSRSPRARRASRGRCARRGARPSPGSWRGRRRPRGCRRTP